MAPSRSDRLPTLSREASGRVQENVAQKLNGPRVVFGSGEAGGHWLLPELYKIGWSRFREAEPGHLNAHRHSGAFEICLIVDGEVEWQASGRTYILRPGDLYITQPGEEHGGVDTAMHPCTLYWLNLGAPSAGCPWPGFSDEEMALIETALSGFDSHRLHGNTSIERAFTSLFDEHRRTCAANSGDGLERGAARAALKTLLIEMVRAHRTANPAELACDREETAPLQIRQAIAAIRRDLGEPHVAEAFAHRVGQPLPHLNRAFVRHLGISIPEFRARERIRAARRQLNATHDSITEIALNLGFSSSQHFSTAFRQITGMTPSAFRQMHAQPALEDRGSPTSA